MEGEQTPPSHLIAGAVEGLVAYVDSTQCCRYLNNRCEEWLGQPIQSLLGLHLREILKEAAYATLRPYVEAALAGNQGTHEQLVDFEGTGKRWTRCQFVPDRAPDGEVRGLLALMVDITERKQTDTELHELRRAVQSVSDSEAMLHGFLENSPNVMYAKDLAGRYVLVNQSYLELFKTTHADLLGKTDYERGIAKDVADAFVRNDRQVAESRKPQVFEEVATINGKKRTYISVKFPLLNTSGQPSYICGISTDITERKEYEQKLLEADRLKDEFLAMLAHELRNPLAPIRNVVEVLKLQSQIDPERLHWALAILDRQATHLTRLVDDLLDVARITTGRIKLREDKVDLTEVVELAVQNVQDRVFKRDLELSLSVPEQPLPIQGDRARLAQVMDNLLDNAIKYTEDGGRIQVSLRDETDEAVIRVLDTGVGIAPETLPRIFELFGQGEHTLDRARGGLGLGLALVKRLIELQGGSVCAVSKGPGRGSEFFVRLPISKPRHAATDRTSHHPNCGARRVLVVDDHQDVAVSTANLLTALGHEALIAGDAIQALSLIEDFRPDVAVVDIGLPGMDGYSLASELRSRTPTLHLIALTGYGQDEDRRRAFEAGFSQHLTKPATVEALMEALCTGVDRR